MPKQSLKAALSGTNPMEWIGEMHNSGVKHVLKNFSLPKGKRSNRSAIEKEVIKLTNNYAKSAGLREMKVVKLQRLSHKVLAETMLKRTDCTKKGVDAVMSIGIAIHQKQTTASLLEEIARQEQKNIKKLKGVDLQHFQSTAALVRHSVILWASKNQGGDEWYKEIPYFKKIEDVDLDEVREWDWIGFEAGFWEGQGPQLGIAFSAADLLYQLAS